MSTKLGKQEGSLREDLTHGADLLGLGLMAAPYAHKLLGGTDASRLGQLFVRQGHNMELAGLGLMMGGGAHYFGKRALNAYHALKAPKAPHLKLSSIDSMLLASFAKSLAEMR